jgi:hypothetical protein
MNIKSLLLGSAAAAVAVSAQAADAIIIAEPEPMEYVRICDTYGTGYFYIPGTETCLRVGGYVRYQMEYNRDEGDDYTFGKLARFAPNFTAKNSTEWGTLTSFAEVEFNWASTGSFSIPAGGQSTNLAHAYISLENDAGTFLVGKTDTPYHNRSLGGLHNGGIWGGVRGNNGNTNSGVVSYTFNAGNGLTATLAAVEPSYDNIITGAASDQFEPNVEAVVRYSQGWGVFVAAAGYDNVHDEWGAKIGGEFNFNPITVGLQFQYGSSPASVYGARFADFSVGGVGIASEYSVLGYARGKLTDTLAARASVQWFDASDAGVSLEAWQVIGGLEWTPVAGLAILPEVRYTTAEANVGGVSVSADQWRAGLRFQRNF